MSPDEPVRTLVVCCRDWPVLALDGPMAGPGSMAGPWPDQWRWCTPTGWWRLRPSARAEGVAVGQRRREAQGRCPGLVVVDHDVDRDARAFEVVAAAVEAFTPRIELSRSRGCAPCPPVVRRATSGATRSWPTGCAGRSRRRWPSAPGRAPPGWGWPTGPSRPDWPPTGPGRSPGPPWSSHRGRRPPSWLRSRSSALDLAALARADDLIDVLVRLGLRTLGDLAAVPAADVVARFGSEGRLAHRLARGLDERPPDTRVPPPHLRVEAVLDPPAERVDTAAFVAKALADELHARLDRPRPGLHPGGGPGRDRARRVASSGSGATRGRCRRRRSPIGCAGSSTGGSTRRPPGGPPAASPCSSWPPTRWWRPPAASSGSGEASPRATSGRSRAFARVPGPARSRRGDGARVAGRARPGRPDRAGAGPRRRSRPPRRPTAPARPGRPPVRRRGRVGCRRRRRPRSTPNPWPARWSTPIGRWCR